MTPPNSLSRNRSTTIENSSIRYVIIKKMTKTNQMDSQKEIASTVTSKDVLTCGSRFTTSDPPR
jgi:hypothetical protein